MIFHYCFGESHVKFFFSSSCVWSQLSIHVVFFVRKKATALNSFEFHFHRVSQQTTWMSFVWNQWGECQLLYYWWGVMSKNRNHSLRKLLIHLFLLPKTLAGWTVDLDVRCISHPPTDFSFLCRFLPPPPDPSEEEETQQSTATP